MNIKTANRLCELRKKNGLSQEELADKLGVSRQAVSKWERSESSPDTDNLIELAKLYGVSLDELINGDEETEEIIQENKEADEQKRKEVIFDENGIRVQSNNGEKIVTVNENGVYIKDKNGEKKYTKEELKKKKKENAVTGIVSAVYLCGTVIAYILLGYFNIAGGFSTWWVLFVGLPVVSSLCDAIVKKNASHFAYPVFVTVVYLVLGMFFKLWHPTWVVFISIPIYYTIINIFNKKENDDDDDDDDDDGDEE